MKKLLQKGLCFVLAIVLGTMPSASVFALPAWQLEMFAQNNILFYDPTGARNFCSSGNGDCVILGSTRDEKLWSGLRHVGFTPEQTAAIIGNIVHEGGTPTRQEDVYNSARRNGCLTKEGKEYTIFLDGTDGAHHGECIEEYSSTYEAGDEVAGIGLGFIQWTFHNRRMGYLKAMEEAGLLKYFEGEAYRIYGGPMDDSELKEIIEKETGSDDDYWALWCTAIKYIYNEMSSNYKEFFNKTTVRDYAAYTATTYENCWNCKVGQSGYNSRIEAAEKYYEKYQNGDFDAVENGSATSATTSPIQRSGNCSVPYNVTEAEDALKIVRQFIIDTNELYGTNYMVPTEVVIGETLSTPADDREVFWKKAVWDRWVEEGVVLMEQNNESWDVVKGTCFGGKYCGQCTAFSGWFVTMLTEYVYNGGDGGQVVGELQKKNPEGEIVKTPVPFSVFSERKNPGHTGVVVGEFGDGTYLTIENNMGDSRKILQVRRRTFGGDASFFVLNDKLRLNNIGRGL